MESSAPVKRLRLPSDVEGQVRKTGCSSPLLVVSQRRLAEELLHPYSRPPLPGEPPYNLQPNFSHKPAPRFPPSRVPSEQSLRLSLGQSVPLPGLTSDSIKDYSPLPSSSFPFLRPSSLLLSRSSIRIERRGSNSQHRPASF